jgi:NADPH-dependent 2,4-dienoyl-CoA reductase/sulfur reductase-like enzyme
MPSERTMPMAQYDPSADERHFVIVGAGAAGNAAAEALRQAGFQGRVTMITKEEDLPYDRPDLSKDFLGSTKRSKPPTLREKDFYDEHGIEVQTGRPVTAADVNTKTVEFEDGTSLTADALLLATGGRARRLPVEGDELENVVTLRSLQDCLRLKELAGEDARAVVVGASFIGMETAASMTRRGVDVTVVAPEEIPFQGPLGPEIGKVFRAMHEEKGIEFRLGRTVDRFEGDAALEAVMLDNGDRLEADFVLEGVGIHPVTDYIQGAELNEDGSVTVDSHLKLADGVWAAGDIARFPHFVTGEPIRIEHWRLAQQHGRIAAMNMAGQDTPYATAPFFWTLHWHFSLQYAGFAPDWDEVILKGDLDERKFLAFYVKGGEILAVAGAGQAVQVAAAAQLLGMNQMPSPDEVRSDEDLAGRL